MTVSAGALRLEAVQQGQRERQDGVDCAGRPGLEGGGLVVDRHVAPGDLDREADGCGRFGLEVVMGD
ncbi:hypothetical protein [Rubrivirga sp.]|uniref:hypothetical protein n=1 Tax=Rubrivirga sp. TaxID=1885344 RepID=UPI003C78373B